jgi:hypothetical protein
LIFVEHDLSGSGSCGVGWNAAVADLQSDTKDIPTKTEDKG